MRALILAAGLGTRLRPLTDSMPKPLVPVGGRPMVEHVLDDLARAGVAEAVINVHYLPGLMRSFVSDWNLRGGIPRLEVQDESALLLDSGGGLAKALPWLFEQGDDLALVCNSDVLGTPDFQALAAAHRRLRDSLGVECTMALRRDPGAGTKYTGLRREGDLVTAFEKPGAPDPALWMFPGYYVVGQEAVKRLPPPAVFGVLEALWKPLASARKLGAWEYSGEYHDLGTVADLRAADEALRNRRR